MCDPFKLAMRKKSTNVLYTEVEKFTNMYAIECGIYSSYNQKFEFLSTIEYVICYVIVI